MSAISITTPAVAQVLQRDATHRATIPIAGLYTYASSGHLEASAGAGFTRIATIGAGTGAAYTGALLNVPAGPIILTTRIEEEPATTVTRAFYGIGDVFGVGWQSNASGRGTNNQAYTHATLKAGLFGNDYVWKELVDPYDDPAGQVDTVSAADGAAGSFVPLLATQIMARTGFPVAFVPGALGGSLAAQWVPGADHLDRTTLYGSLNYRLSQVGGCRAVLLWGGESDALAGNSQAAVNASLDLIANGYFADRAVLTMFAKFQNCSGIGDAAEAVIRAAITEAEGDNVHVAIGPDLSDLPSDDLYHLMTDAHLLTAATRWFTALVTANLLPIGPTVTGGVSRTRLQVGM